MKPLLLHRRHLARSPRPARRACLAVSVACLIGLIGLAPVAHADHHEAQWSARPFAGLAQLHEDGAPSTATAPLGGASLGVSYGLSNRADLGAEVLAFSTAAASFADTTLRIDGGGAITGALSRRTAAAHLLIGPTWRLGVAWVPVITLELGGGVRARSEGAFAEPGFVPAQKRASTGLDLSALARIGVERRLNRRLTVGVYATALTAWGPSAPLLPAAALSLGVAYVHYPLW